MREEGRVDGQLDCINGVDAMSAAFSYLYLTFGKVIREGSGVGMIY